MKKKQSVVNPRLSRLQLNYATNGKKGKRHHTRPDSTLNTNGLTNPVSYQDNTGKLIINNNDQLNNRSKTNCLSSYFSVDCFDDQNPLGCFKSVVDPIYYYDPTDTVETRTTNFNYPMDVKNSVEISNHFSDQLVSQQSNKNNGNKNHYNANLPNLTASNVGLSNSIVPQIKQIQNNHNSVANSKIQISQPPHLFQPNQLITDCLIDRKHKIIMLFTPRASCTLVAAIFIHHLGLYLEAMSISSWIHQYRRTVLEKKTINLTIDKDLKNPNLTKIKTVRNPYFRAVSSYTHFIRSIANVNSSFEEYLVDILENRPANLTNKQLIIRTYHSKIQRNKNTDHLVNHFIKIENIEEELKLIDYRYKTSFYNSYLAVRDNNSHIVDKDKSVRDYVGDKEGNYFRLPNQKFRIPDYLYFYNKKTKFLVDQIYGDDIKYFGYKWPFDVNDNLI